MSPRWNNDKSPGRKRHGLLKLSVFMLILSLIVPLLPMPAMANYFGFTDPVDYGRYYGSTVVKDQIFAIYDKARNETIPAYCWDKELAQPNLDQGNKQFVYFETNDDTVPINKLEQGIIERMPGVKKFMDVTDAKNQLTKSPTGEYYANDPKIVKMFYNGYPTNAAGLQGHYGLSDKQFQKVTQYALWRMRGASTTGELNDPNEVRAFYYLLHGTPFNAANNKETGNIGFHASAEYDDKTNPPKLQAPPEAFKVQILFTKYGYDGEKVAQRLAVVKMVNMPTLFFAKVDDHAYGVGGAELQLQVLSINGKPVPENEKQLPENETKHWTSDKHGHVLALKDLDGAHRSGGQVILEKEYRLFEVRPPAGYQKAPDQPTEVQFKVERKKDGTFSYRIRQDDGSYAEAKDFQERFDLKITNERVPHKILLHKIDEKGAPLPMPPLK